MSLHYVPVKPSVNLHATLKVHQVALLEVAEIASEKRLLNRSNGICTVAVDANHRQAHAIVAHALVYAQLIDEGAGHRQMHIAAGAIYAHYAGGFFHYS